MTDNIWKDSQNLEMSSHKIMDRKYTRHTFISLEKKQQYISPSLADPHNSVAADQGGLL